MGQRLVCTIIKDRKEICNIYYHWSAYTYDALLETRKIINCIYNHADETTEELLLRLIHFCENNGGGISNGRNGNEWKYVQNLYPNEQFKADGINRTYGLISLSRNEMAESQAWSEGDVYIDLDTDQVEFGIYSGYEDFDEYIEERKSWDEDFDKTELDNMPKFDFNLGVFDVSDIDIIIAGVDSVDGEGVIICDDEICELTC